jgi:hypothetical protein
MSTFASVLGIGLASPAGQVHSGPAGSLTQIRKNDPCHGSPLLEFHADASASSDEELE